MASQTQPENFAPNLEATKPPPQLAVAPRTPADLLASLAREGRDGPPEGQAQLRTALSGATGELVKGLTASTNLHDATAARLSGGVSRIAGPEAAITQYADRKSVTELADSQAQLEAGTLSPDDIVARVATIEASVISNIYRNRGSSLAADGAAQLRTVG